MDRLPLGLPTLLPGSGAQLSWVQWPADQITLAMAHDVAERLRQAIAQRGQAHLCVSGGKSPVALMKALSRQPLDWSRVQISLADERCVPTVHPDSNAALVREQQGGTLRVEVPLPPGKLSKQKAAVKQQ